MLSTFRGYYQFVPSQGDATGKWVFVTNGKQAGPSYAQQPPVYTTGTYMLFNKSLKLCNV